MDPPSGGSEKSNFQLAGASISNYHIALHPAGLTHGPAIDVAMADPRLDVLVWLTFWLLPPPPRYDFQSSRRTSQISWHDPSRPIPIGPHLPVPRDTTTCEAPCLRIVRPVGTTRHLRDHVRSLAPRWVATRPTLLTRGADDW